MVTFLGELGRPTTAEEFPSHLVALVEAMVPGVIVGFDEIPAPGQYRLTHNMPMSAQEAARHFAVLAACYQQNPIYDYIQGGRDLPVRVSDLASRSRFHNTELYQEMFRHVGIEHQLHVVVPVRSGSVSLSMNHQFDFTIEQVEIFRMLAPEIARAYYRAQTTPGTPSVEAGLTQREQEVWRWLRDGKRNREIGIILGISERTVEKHVERVLAKLGVETRAAAIALGTPAPASSPFRSGVNGPHH